MNAALRRVTCDSPLSIDEIEFVSSPVQALNNPKPLLALDAGRSTWYSLGRGPDGCGEASPNV